MENEIRKLRESLRSVEQKHAEARSAADKVRDDVRESGADIASDRDAFEKVDEAYKAADTLRDEAAELRTREARLLEIAGERATESRDSGERR